MIDENCTSGDSMSPNQNLGIGSSRSARRTTMTGCYRVYIGKDYPKALKLTEIKAMVREFTEEYLFPPKECLINPTLMNDRIIDRLHELNVSTISSRGGVLAWELHLGPIPPP